eukprot:jgi/Psemu1/207010/e_gw1.423.10.1
MLSTSAVTLPTAFLIVATLSVASAFQNSGAPFSVKANIPLFDAQTGRPYSRSFGTRICESRVRSLSSPTSFSRVSRKQQRSSTLTQLKFSDDGGSNVDLEPSWWRKIFTAPQSSESDSSVDTRTTDLIKSEEQENVDAYLEFLDRRYRRLHCDDEKEATAKSAPQHDSSEAKTTKPFSAMDWLMKGNGSSNPNALATTREQQEDALYVLGVAGLASQKLLQKHQLPTTMSQQPKETSDTATIDKVVELKEQIDDAIEVSSNTSMKSDINSLILKNVLIPVVRVLYLMQRRKQLLVQMIQQGVKAVATKATSGLSDTLAQGPKAVMNTILSVGGGKQNMLRTVAIGYATILVFRPLLHAVFAEGLAFEPLIK